MIGDMFTREELLEKIKAQLRSRLPDAELYPDELLEQGAELVLDNFGERRLERQPARGRRRRRRGRR